VVVHITEIQFRMLAAIYRDLQQGRAELIVFHTFCELVTYEIHELTNARLLEHIEYAHEAAELIARSKMAKLRQRG
ncbi:MAG: hypothetical protein M3Z41_05355, partial [Candidatus Eremiobacteraeota bacterium]|nr:hypothetical protein [Candidatus Eremiobacteraeota bacterium]